MHHSHSRSEKKQKENERELGLGIDIQLARKWIFVKNTMVKLGDMSKGAACIKMAAAKLGWVEEIGGSFLCDVA